MSFIREIEQTPHDAEASSPPFLPRPSWSVFNSNHLSAETCDELLSVGLFSKAPDVDPRVVAPKRMAAPTERQVLTEIAHHVVCLSQRYSFRKRDLKRPPVIDLKSAQLALASDHVSRLEQIENIVNEGKPDVASTQTN